MATSPNPPRASRLTLRSETPAAAIATATRGGPPRHRLLYIDNLHILLTGLVVIHHAAVTYSDIPMWYYTEPAKDRSGVALDVLLIFDQTFFMGFFFLISGYFVPTSYDHKGGRAFLQDRLVRLGIPLVVFAVLLGPILGARYYALAGRGCGEGSRPVLLVLLPELMEPGPAVVRRGSAAVLRLSCWLADSGLDVPRSADRGGASPTAGGIHGRDPRLLTGARGADVPLADGCARRANLADRGPAHARLSAQYASLFVVGLVACRRGWAQALPVSAGWYGLTRP